MNVRFFSVIVTVTLLAAPEIVAAEGVYGGAGLGIIQIEDLGSGYAIDDNPSGSRFFIGFEASQKFAFEAVFFASDTATQGSGLPETRADFRGVAIYAVGLAATGYRGHPVARLGLFTGKFDIESATQTIDTRKSGVALGLGYILDLNKRVSVRGDFDTFISDVDTLSIGTISIQFRFGD